MNPHIGRPKIVAMAEKDEYLLLRIDCWWLNKRNSPDAIEALFPPPRRTSQAPIRGECINKNFYLNPRFQVPREFALLNYHQAHNWVLINTWVPHRSMVIREWERWHLQSRKTLTHQIMCRSIL